MEPLETRAQDHHPVTVSLEELRSSQPPKYLIASTEESESVPSINFLRNTGESVRSMFIGNLDRERPSREISGTPS